LFTTDPAETDAITGASNANVFAQHSERETVA